MNYRFSKLLNWFEYTDKIASFNPITLELVFFKKDMASDKKYIKLHNKK